MNIKDIQQLIKFVAKSGVSEVKIESKDLKIGIKTTPSEKKFNHPTTSITTQPAVQPLEETISEVQETTSIAENVEHDNKFLTIKSPIIGTFYRKPSPDKPNFIEPGDSVSEGDILCVIEAMKLFNEIESDFSGKIVKVLVEDASPVEFDQPLFLIDPS
tara:strand:- start:1579 stop:2055 length:477 start_codon:yes stop_codon:yes gene_type:complete